MSKLDLLFETSIIKTIYFNLKSFGFSKGIKLPVLIAKKTKFKNLDGKIELESFSTGNVKIGYLSTFGINNKTVLELKNSSVLKLGNGSNIGKGSWIQVDSEAELFLGVNTKIGDNTKIIALKSIRLEDGVFTSWNCTITDSDRHQILIGDKQINENDDVIINSDTWLGAEVMILKGSKIGSSSIVGAKSLVSGKFEDNKILAGIPAKIISKEEFKIVK